MLRIGVALEEILPDRFGAFGPSEARKSTRSTTSAWKDGNTLESKARPMSGLRFGWISRKSVRQKM
jgi:hypothetical protein